MSSLEPSDTNAQPTPAREIAELERERAELERETAKLKAWRKWAERTLGDPNVEPAERIKRVLDAERLGFWS